MGFIGRDDELTEIELIPPDELDAPAPAEPAIQPVPHRVLDGIRAQQEASPHAV